MKNNYSYKNTYSILLKVPTLVYEYINKVNNNFNLELLT